MVPNLSSLPLKKIRSFTLICTLLIVITSCGNGEQDAERSVDQWWANLQELCGNAYEGSLGHADEGYDLLDGSEVTIAHFRECDEDTIKIPFHIETAPGEWDRSRTWVLFKHEHDIELRHDHRLEDGSEDEGNTWYGGFSMNEGTTRAHEFLYPPRTQELGVPMGWRIIARPDREFVYGTIRDGQWTFRVDFDVTKEVEAPPAPWGHE